MIGPTDALQTLPSQQFRRPLWKFEHSKHARTSQLLHLNSDLERRWLVFLQADTVHLPSPLILTPVSKGAIFGSSLDFDVIQSRKKAIYLKCQTNSVSVDEGSMFSHYSLKFDLARSAHVWETMAYFCPPLWKFGLGKLCWITQFAAAPHKNNKTAVKWNWEEGIMASVTCGVRTCWIWRQWMMRSMMLRTFIFKFRKSISIVCAKLHMHSFESKACLKDDFKNTEQWWRWWWWWWTGGDHSGGERSTNVYSAAT